MNAPTILTPEPIFKQCRECGMEWKFEFSPYLATLVHVCPTCSQIHADEEVRQLIARSAAIRTEAWKAICPPDFLNIEPHRLPKPSKLQIVLKWQFGPKGLLLHGPTGSGKSRCAWHLLKREHATGRSVRAIDHSVGLEYGALFAQSAADADRWRERLVCVDILFMDDVFKAKLTDSLESALFTIVSARTERQRPIIVTTNDSGETLAARTTDDRGAALIRRLREFCQSIQFL